MTETKPAVNANTHAERKHLADVPGWPANQFHPIYNSFKEWLDNEAEPRPLGPAGPRNRRRLRTATREPL